MPPAVIDALEAFRNELERHDLSQAQRMARAWLDVTRQLHGDMELLAREIAERQAGGLPVTRWHIARTDRYQTLAGQLREQARRFVAVASDDVTEAQRLLAEWGVSQSADLITAQMGGVSIVGQFDRISVAAVEGMIGNTGAGTPLGTLLRTIPGEAAEGMTRALVRGIALGWHPTRTAQAMREGAAVGYERALLIARTEQMRVYRAASQEQYRASGVVRGYRRVASKSIRTCMACLMLDGTFYPLSEPFYDHPAGRCVAVPELDNAPRLQWTNGEAWFRAQDEATQRQMMGPGRFDAWRAGLFDLPDLVTIRDDPVWGRSPSVTSLRRLTAR